MCWFNLVLSQYLLILQLGKKTNIYHLKSYLIIFLFLLLCLLYRGCFQLSKICIFFLFNMYVFIKCITFYKGVSFCMGDFFKDKHISFTIQAYFCLWWIVKRNFQSFQSVLYKFTLLSKYKFFLQKFWSQASIWNLIPICVHRKISNYILSAM